MAASSFPAFTTTPLVDPIDKEEFARFWPAHPGYPDWVSNRVGLNRLFWFAIIFVAFCLTGAADLTIQPYITEPLPNYFYLVSEVGFSLLGFPTLAGFWERLDIKAERVYRLSRFAGANNLGYSPITPQDILTNPPLGLIFAIPDARITRVYQLIGTATPVPFRTGFCDVKRPAGSSGEVANWTFLEVILDRELPHIVLDSKHNGSNKLPAQFPGSSELHLEGDFDRWFHTYALSPNAADALYVLSPDVMAALIDNASQADVEVVGNRLYFYFPRHVNVLDPAWWQWVEQTVATIGARVKRTSGHSSFRPSDARQKGVRYRNRWIRRALRLAGAALLVAAAVLIAHSLS